MADCTAIPTDFSRAFAQGVAPEWLFAVTGVISRSAAPLAVSTIDSVCQASILAGDAPERLRSFCKMYDAASGHYGEAVDAYCRPLADLMDCYGGYRREGVELYLPQYDTRAEPCAGREVCDFAAAWLEILPRRDPGRVALWGYALWELGLELEGAGRPVDLDRYVSRLTPEECGIAAGGSETAVARLLAGRLPALFAATKGATCHTTRSTMKQL